MNEKFNLAEILKDCPEGTKLYSPVFGEVEFESINDIIGPIVVTTNTGNAECFTADGKMYTYYNGECLLFPSKEQRDWSKFNVEKPKFDPKTFQPFDKVLIKRSTESYHLWFPDFISLPPNNDNNKTLCMCIGDDIAMVIPYNNDTKHLVGTNEEAPEYYRYWED